MYCQSQFANRCPPFRFECLSVDLNLSVSEIELIFLLGYGFLTHTAQFLTLDHQVFPIRGARNLGVPTDSFLTSLTMHLSCWNLLYVVPQIHLPPPPFPWFRLLLSHYHGYICSLQVSPLLLSLFMVPYWLPLDTAVFTQLSHCMSVIPSCCL